MVPTIKCFAQGMKKNFALLLNIKLSEIFLQTLPSREKLSHGSVKLTTKNLCFWRIKLIFEIFPGFYRELKYFRFGLINYIKFV